MNFLELIFKTLNEISNKEQRNRVFTLINFLLSNLIPKIELKSNQDLELYWIKKDEYLFLTIKLDRDYVYVIHKKNNITLNVEQIHINEKEELLDKVLKFIGINESKNSSNLKPQPLSYKDLPRTF